MKIWQNSLPHFPLYEMVDEDDNETVGIIDLDKFFQGKLDLPALLPRSIGDEFESDYLTDPTIGGILPEETIDSNLTAEIREFLDLEVYQAVEETNTDANATQPVPVPTWTVSTCFVPRKISHYLLATDSRYRSTTANPILSST